LNEREIGFHLPAALVRTQPSRARARQEAPGAPGLVTPALPTSTPVTAPPVKRLKPGNDGKPMQPGPAVKPGKPQRPAQPERPVKPIKSAPGKGGKRG
jgi:hypothetical protein